LPTIDGFSDAVAHIYDASLDVERWGEALERIGGLFMSPKRQVVVTTSATDPRMFIRLSGFSEHELQKQDRFLELSQHDPRASWQRFKAIHCRQVVSDEVLHASEMYRQVLGPAGVEYSMYFIVDLGDQLMCVLSVMRGPEGEPFTDENCAEFSRFVPHVQRATTMFATFERLRGEIAATRAVIDAVPMGIMVVEDEELRVANQAARRILQEGDALQCTSGRLRGASRRADVELREAIDEARDSGHAVALTLPIEHVEPVRAVARRLHPASAGMFGARNDAVALYVTDPRKPIETNEEVLQRLFGLTSREAAVLRILVEGGDLKAAAAKLAVSHETVRSHLKHIMETTGASRQADLVRMVLSSPAWMAGKK
jgi:DNA-binding CsgD family transcriptional regulator/PAS domain-containing protein